MTEADSVGALLERVRALEAEQDFRSLVDELQALDRTEILAEPGLGLALAIGLRVVGEADASLELATAVAEPARRTGSDRLTRRLLNLQAALRFERGDVEDARRLWDQLLERATRDGDQDMVAKTSNNLGVLHTLHDRPREALGAYARARAACQRIGDRRGLAQAFQNLAITYRETDFFAEAHTHFDEAAAHARAVRAEDVLGRVEEERALLFLLEGDPMMAEVGARRALERLAAIGDVAGQGEALRVLGLVELADGRLAEAGEHLEGALDHAATTGAPLLEAETLEALAALARRGGADDDVVRYATRAEELFQRIGAAAWGRRIRGRVARLVERDPGPAE